MENCMYSSRADGWMDDWRVQHSKLTLNRYNKNCAGCGSSAFDCHEINNMQPMHAHACLFMMDWAVGPTVGYRLKPI